MAERLLHAVLSPGQVPPRKRERAWVHRFRALREQATEVLMQCAVVAVLASLGDVIAQSCEGASVSELDAGRLVRFVAFRACLGTPIYLVWLRWLERAAIAAVGGSATKQAAFKVALDQTFYTPMYQVVFYLTLAAAEGQPLRVGWRRCYRILPRSLPASWAFWIPVQAVNFWAVPLRGRVVFVNLFALVWSVFLSSFNQSARVATAGETANLLPCCPAAPFQPARARGDRDRDRHARRRVGWTRGEATARGRRPWQPR